MGKQEIRDGLIAQQLAGVWPRNPTVAEEQLWSSLANLLAEHWNLTQNTNSSSPQSSQESFKAVFADLVQRAKAV